ncbi:large ribosomal subunit protein mL49 isoform X2 [Prorops nasuta]|uniref:large ribosomal subunit protein mL49 isoform X2 n=1 Tax=Prorops nasuta TaxID=863751 RepID=UPI0034CDBD40
MVQKRNARFNASPQYSNTLKYPECEISKDPNEWKYVEWTLRPKIIAEPPMDKLNLPSGWVPPTASPNDYPYFIRRTKNHMLPVHLYIGFRGYKRVTRISRIEGDIWALEAELKVHIEQNRQRVIGSQINEPASTIKFRGDHVNLVKNWLLEKGF